MEKKKKEKEIRVGEKKSRSFNVTEALVRKKEEEILRRSPQRREKKTEIDRYGTKMQRGHQKRKEGGL